MGIYQSTPVQVEAEQFWPDRPLPFHDADPVVNFGCPCGDSEACSSCGKWWVETIHGERAHLAAGDYVVREEGSRTAAYPVKPDIFERRYVAIEQ